MCWILVLARVLRHLSSRRISLATNRDIRSVSWPTIFQRLVDILEQQPLLRVHEYSFCLRNPKKWCIKPRYIFLDEMASDSFDLYVLAGFWNTIGLTVWAYSSSTLWVTVEVSIKVHSVFGKWPHLRLSLEQRGPQFLGILSFIGKTACHSNYRNGLDGIWCSHADWVDWKTTVGGWMLIWLVILVCSQCGFWGGSTYIFIGIDLKYPSFTMMPWCSMPIGTGRYPDQRCTRSLIPFTQRCPVFTRFAGYQEQIGIGSKNLSDFRIPFSSNSALSK